MGKWIWINDSDTEQPLSENTRGCFASRFMTTNLQEEILLSICAVTKYMVYLNGKEIGRGPMRCKSGTSIYDNYLLNSCCRRGENYLAIRVWNYGWSTYQSIGERPGLDFSVIQKGIVLVQSDEMTQCQMDEGYLTHAPKRNVNLGFAEYYDGRKGNLNWIFDKDIIKGWKGAFVMPEKNNTRQRFERPIRMFDTSDVHPAKVEAIQDVTCGCFQVTVNVRRAFFQNRRDADETIFSGFIGGILISEKNMDGIISFPNRTWNGIIGDFRLGATIYQVSNQTRDIPVHLKAGEQFFMMQVSGKFDDLYCHMELQFSEKVCWKSLDGKKKIFTVGPTDRIISALDGRSRIYGGLEEFNRMENHTKEHKYIWASASYEELLLRAGSVKFVDENDVYEDLYLLSLARLEKVVSDYAVTVEDCGILWDNQNSSVIGLPEQGDYRRMIVDFGTIRVGQPVFTLNASEGTVIDFYGFENYYQKKIDYTIGLNNAIHYVASEGWQTYRCMARMGMRYALITVRNTKTAVKIQDFHICHQTYSLSNMGQFKSSDKELNEIFEMCRDTNRLCTEDSFTDCPTYEQAFWTGDAQLSSLVNAWLFGDYKFAIHNQRLAVSAFDNSKMMNALTPTDWNTSIPMWMMNWVISVFETAAISNSFAHVEELYQPMKEVLEHYGELITDEGGFLINAWNMLDWAPMDIENYGIVTAQQGMLAYCYGLVAAYAERTGRMQTTVRFKDYRERLLSYIDKHLWDEKRKMYIDGWTPIHGFSKTVSIQTHTLLYLYDGIIDYEKKKMAEKYLLNPPEYFIKIGSPFMLYFLYEVYAKLGLLELLFRDIKRRWGEMLRFDTTTCWEVFPGFYENSRTRSYCHSWSATPAYFMLQYLVGIRVLEDGFQKVTFERCPIELSWCRSSIPTPHGMMVVEWEYKDGIYEVQLQLPEGINFVDSLLEHVNIHLKILKKRR
ncbi:MAG: alpha-L-rhamnosidase C-terminal domain-containing protein [Lachnospiraceae bacterium]